jgi:hypothetical protein
MVQKIIATMNYFSFIRIKNLFYRSLGALQAD